MQDLVHVRQAVSSKGLSHSLGPEGYFLQSFGKFPMESLSYAYKKIICHLNKIDKPVGTKYELQWRRHTSLIVSEGQIQQ